MSIPVDRPRPLEDGRASVRARSSPASPSGTAAAERITDDLLVEILSRAPAKSICRFKCVSKHWLGLIHHPDHRKNLPQTLAGFFYSSRTSSAEPVYFASVSGPLIDTSFAFLPNHRRVEFLDCCNGLLLCRWYGASAQGSESRYVVCNPATEKWVVCDPAPENWPVLPDSGQIRVGPTRLGFDPAVSSHFHVFELVEEVYWDGGRLTVVQVYSSETGRWVRREKGFNEAFGLINPQSAAVFLNGHLYFHAFDRRLSCCLATVDTEGETWMNFAIPYGGVITGFIQCSQGRLHYANFYRDEDDDTMVRLEVYVLQNYESKEWILKHAVETSDLFGSVDVIFPDFDWVGIHPECNLIFFTAGRGITFMCYNMDSRQVKVIRNLEDGNLSYLPYVPLYAELQSLHM